jgi:hypothetical protein
MSGIGTPKLKASRDCDGTVNYPAKFLELSAVYRADLLQDWIYDLTAKYYEAVDDTNKSVRELAR